MVLEVLGFWEILIAISSNIFLNIFSRIFLQPILLFNDNFWMNGPLSQFRSYITFAWCMICFTRFGNYFVIYVRCIICLSFLWFRLTRAKDLKRWKKRCTKGGSDFHYHWRWYGLLSHVESSSSFKLFIVPSNGKHYFFESWLRVSKELQKESFI